MIENRWLWGYQGGARGRSEIECRTQAVLKKWVVIKPPHFLIPGSLLTVQGLYRIVAHLRCTGQMDTGIALLPGCMHRLCSI